MLAKNIFFGAAFIVLGILLLAFNRILAEEGNRFRFVRPPLHPTVARVGAIVSGIVTILFGIALLTGIINWT